MTACLVGPGCGRSAEESRSGVVTELIGPSVVIDTTSTSGPVAAVGDVRVREWKDTTTSCAGVAMAPDVVLTAAHCLCDARAATLNFSFQLAQGGSRKYSVCSYNKHPDYDCDEKIDDVASDIAVLHLGVPRRDGTCLPDRIDAAVLRDYPRLPRTGLRSVHYSDPLIVGGIDGDPLARVSGDPGPVALTTDYCNVGDLWCTGGTVWSSNQTSEGVATIQYGDSGGPLYLSEPLPGGGRTVALVGILHGRNSPARERAYWASIHRNARFLREHAPTLFEDEDGDGVPEWDDNCPLSRCQVRGTLDPAAACYNPGQADLDGDGVGDACDNCSPDVCATDVAPGVPLSTHHLARVNCYNPAQKDEDGDEIGDTCDLCPTWPASGGAAQRDADLDGVGDTCETCEGTAELVPCRSDSDCAIIPTVGAAPWCTSEGALFGRCSHERDDDSDGILNGCDLCEGFIGHDDENANALAEERGRLNGDASLASLGDACDPVPVVGLARQGPTVMKRLEAFALTPGDGVGPDDVVSVKSRRVLGRETPNDGARFYSARTKFAHCSCIDGDGMAQALDVCINRSGGAGGACDWNQPEIGPNFVGVTLQDPVTRQPVSDASGMVAAVSFVGGFSIDQQHEWRWRADRIGDRVSGFGTCATPTDECRTWGVVFTWVEGPANVSTRDQGTLGDLRDAFQLYEAPRIEVFDPIPADTPPIPVPAPGPMSLRLAPWATLSREPTRMDQLFPVPAAIYSSPLGPVAALGGGRLADATDLLSPGLTAALASGGFVVAHPVESSRRLRRLLAARSAPVAVLVSRGAVATEELAVEVVEAGDSGFTLRGEGEGDDLVAATSRAAGGPPASGLGGPLHVVLSVRDLALYLTGGHLAPDRTVSGDLWRFDFTTGAWSELSEAMGNSPSAAVLGMAYDSEGRRLYVVDVDLADERLPGAPGAAPARLVEFDLRAHSSRELARWPHTGTRGMVSLVALDDGRVALTSGSSGDWMSCLYRVVEGRARLDGVARDRGRLLDVPVMSGDHPVMPVLVDGAVQMVDLRAERFRGGGPCAAL